jgi:HAD superfamily hydrolase (TIGR01549 family)
MIDPRLIHVVAFDCDGVMFDSAQANQAYYNHLLKHIGQPAMTPEQHAFAQMHTVDEALEFLIHDPDLLSEARQYRLQMRYLSFIRHMVVEPTLKTLLAALQPAFKTAIATNRTDTMDRVLSEHGLEGRFDMVVTASDVPHPKPHPDQLNVILAHFDIDPEKMIYIGDSLLDGQAARAAGVPFIAYRNSELDAERHIESLQEIQDVLGL